MGKLEVTICGARNLHDNQVVSLPDPYARVKCEDRKYKTPVVNNCLNPTWTETYRFQVADDNSAQVVFELWNKNIISDDVMGTYSLSIGGLTRGVVQDQWYLLDNSKTNAELHVRLLACDFGVDPLPEDKWKVTSDINDDPVLKAGDRPPGNTQMINGNNNNTNLNMNATSAMAPQQPGYPPQQPGYPPQLPGYPPQQPGYPPQLGYPPQQPAYAPPPQQPAYPPQLGYPPQQPAYSPQPAYRPQPGYAPQLGYSPQQPAYAPPPQQLSYSQQAAFRPPQPAYPPQPGYAPQPAYPPQQPSYPAQSGYPPEPGRRMQGGGPGYPAAPQPRVYDPRASGYKY